MMFTEWRQWLNRTFKKSKQSPIRRNTARLTFDPLEARWLPSTNISVFVTNNSYTEGTNSCHTIGSFTDSAYSGTSNYTAQISWGDGTSNLGSLTPGSPGTYTVMGNHTYADEGNDTVTITVSETGGTGGSYSAFNTGNSTVAEADTITANPSTISITPTEGTAYTGTLATFRDTYLGQADASDFSATINWGDGTSTSGNVTDGGTQTSSIVVIPGTLTFVSTYNAFSVSGSHTYADEGNYSVSVTLNDDSPSTVTATASGTASVQEGDSLAPISASPTITEGTAYTGTVATFSDSYGNSPTADLSATINWGDGSSGVGTVSGGSGTFSVAGNHNYADEGSYSISVTISDNSPGTDSSTATGIATVVEGDSFTPFPGTLHVTEGTDFVRTAAIFTNTNLNNNASDFSATINWGDGTSLTTGTVTDDGSGTYFVTGEHTYADEGIYSVTVDIRDNYPGTLDTTAHGTAIVAEADAFDQFGGISLTGTEGTVVSGIVALFADTGYTNNNTGDFTATINWGDGTSSSGSIGGGGSIYTVTGSHTYADEGQFTAVVTINDDAPGTATQTANTAVSMAEADSLTLTGLSVTPTEGTAFTGTVATFTDSYSNSAGDFNATINWGDGTSTTGTVTSGSLACLTEFAPFSVGPSGTTYSISGNHTYADEGSYSISVTVHDDSPGTASTWGSAQASVVEGDSFTPNGVTISGTEGTVFSGVAATFADTNVNNTSGDFSATINWGDGTSTSGSVTGGGGTFSVSGSHNYLASGSFSVSVSIADDAPGTAGGTASSTAVMSGDVVVNGTSQDDTLTLVRTPGSGFGNVTYTLTDPTGSPANVTMSLAGVHSFTFNGLGGNDTMNVTLAPGGSQLIPANITFDGGTGTNVLNFDANHAAVGTTAGIATSTHNYFAGNQTLHYLNVATTNLNNANSVQAFYGPNTALRSTAFTGLSADERFVQAIYLDALGRAGSKGELDGWVGFLHAVEGPSANATQQSKGQLAVASLIERSTEASDRLVKTWYQTFLGRPAVGGEENGWVAQLVNGDTEETVLARILSVPTGDFRAKYPSETQFVQALFQVLLNQTVSASDAANSGWDVVFQAGVKNAGGNVNGGYLAVARGFLLTNQFRQDQVEGYYDALLHTPGDTGLFGITAWAASGIDLRTMRTVFESTNGPTGFYSNG